jgi:release factor glutamine methyltransferase
MKLKELKQVFITSIQDQYSRDECIALFDITAYKIFNISKSYFIIRQEEEASTTDERSIQDIVKQLQTGKPIQYILGETTFYGLKFFVDEHVLIPRFETEELVQLVIKTLKKNGYEFKKVLDIGTGTGCIPITIKHALPELQVAAIDISPEALTIAKRNADLNEVQVDFYEADMLLYQSTEHYDVIISNPPYIRAMEKADMHQNVLDHEPHLALFVSNEKPLIFYEAIAKFGRTNLTPNGMLFLEINEYLGSEMKQMLSEAGFVNISLIQDMQGKDRIISCQLN